VSDSAEFAFHAWVDESMHVDAGLYILAAVVCDPDGCDAIRDTMRSLLDVDQPKLHWVDESPERREKIAGTVAQIDMAAVVVIGTPMSRKKQERARAVCLESMVVHLAGMGVKQVLLEERTESLNVRDRQLIIAIRGKKLIPSGMRIEIGKPSVEPMLWVPDAIAGAVGADRVHGRPQYLDAIGPIEVLDVPLR
jgi:hypothetical protein